MFLSALFIWGLILNRATILDINSFYVMSTCHNNYMGLVLLPFLLFMEFYVKAGWLMVCPAACAPVYLLHTAQGVPGLREIHMNTMIVVPVLVSFLYWYTYIALKTIRLATKVGGVYFVLPVGWRILAKCAVR